MHKTYLYIIIVAAIFTSCSKQMNIEYPKVEKGIFDLSKYTLKQSEELNIDGEWEFYWEQFLLPNEIIDAKQQGKTEYVKTPGNWSESNKYPPFGYATLSIEIRGLTPGTPYALYIPEMLTAFKLFLNENEIFSNGEVGKTVKLSKPQFLPGTVSFESETDKVVLTCHVSNFDHRNSGIWRSVRIGTYKAINQHRENTLILEIFLSAVLLAISIFHIGIFIYRKEEKAELLFGIICLVLFLRTITTGEQILSILLPSFPWEIARKMEYSPFYLVAPLFMLFMSELFPKESIKLFNKIYIIISGIIGLFYLLFPVRITNNTILVAELFLLIGILYAFSILTRALLKKRPNVLLIIIAFSILAGSSINDILFSRQIIQTMYFSPIGFLVFIIIQSQMLSRRYAKSIRDVTGLSLQLKTINQSLSRFVPFQFLQYLQKNSILDVHLGDQVLKNMTVLFADIRSFTSLSEAMTPEENFKFLNSFLSQVVPVIRKHDGFVDKFIGDAIMALFSFPPENAVKAALELQKVVRQYNQERLKAGYRNINVGIGVHTGQLMLGTIGETNRMETTVIADAVNIASRLEELTKIYDAPIIVSKILFDEMDGKNAFANRSLGEATVKGKRKPIEIVEILDRENSGNDKIKIESKNEFEAAIVAFKEKDYYRAAELFRKVLDFDPNDKAATMYHKHCIEHQINSKN